MPVTDLESVSPPATGETIATKTINAVDVQVILPLIGDGTTADYITPANPMPQALYDAAGARVGFPSPVKVTATPSIDTGAYAAFDNLDGDIISFANAVSVSGGTGHILSASFLVKSDVTPTLTLYLLDSSITPEAQNAAFTMSDANAEKVVAVIHTSTGTWEDLVASRKNMQAFGPPKPFKLASGTTLYAVAVTESAYTPGVTTDLVISLLIQPD